MCGVAGAFGKDLSEEILSVCLNSIEKRGPDDSGSYTDEFVQLSHTRLAIQDISSNGAQPMKSSDQNWVIAFNGEIYNHLELRDKYLSDRAFRGHSDTETILCLVEKFGVIRAVELLVGMFAIAFYNAAEKKLYLTRDSNGEKPLFFRADDERVYFCSDLDGLGDLTEVSDISVAEYIILGFVPPDKTIYRTVDPVAVGTVVIFEHNSKGELVSDCIKYSPCLNAKKGLELPDLFSNILTDNTLSDVPVGLFLSGGIDSSLICANLNLANKSFCAVTFGAISDKIDESRIATLVAEYFSMKHSIVSSSKNDLAKQFSRLIDIDQPFSDPSTLATFALAEFLHKETDVKVVLSGDGADEIFYGYNRHLLYFNFVKIFGLNYSKITSSAFKMLSKAIQISKFFGFNMNSKINSFINDIAIKDDLRSSFLRAYSGYTVPRKFHKLYSGRILNEFFCVDRPLHEVDKYLYLPGNVLVKSDKALMSFGLEARSPFVDLRIQAFAKTLDVKRSIGLFKGKLVLRNLLKQKLPGEIHSLKKRGFTVPLKEWIELGMLPSLPKVEELKFLECVNLPCLSEEIERLHTDGLNSKNVIFYWRLIVLEYWFRQRKPIKP